MPFPLWMRRLGRHSPLFYREAYAGVGAGDDEATAPTVGRGFGILRPLGVIRILSWIAASKTGRAQAACVARAQRPD